MNNLIFSALTQEQQMAIADGWTPPAGLILNERNGAIIRNYIIAKGAQWNDNSFTAAALILKDRLEWNYADLRSAKAKLQDLGIRPSAHRSQDDQEADFNAKKKLAQQFIEHGPLAQRRRHEENQRRYAAEHVTLYFERGPRRGCVDHAGSEIARNEAIARHKAADAAAKN